jgi:hypothetical protein
LNSNFLELDQSSLQISGIPLNQTLSGLRFTKYQNLQTCLNLFKPTVQASPKYAILIWGWGGATFDDDNKITPDAASSSHNANDFRISTE